jgi:hypothetical protein
MPSLTIVLQPSEYDALRTLAQRERRKAKQQASVILRDRLRRAGLLKNETAPIADTLAGEAMRAALPEPQGPV